MLLLTNIIDHEYIAEAVKELSLRIEMVLKELREGGESVFERSYCFQIFGIRFFKGNNLLEKANDTLKKHVANFKKALRHRVNELEKLYQTFEYRGQRIAIESEEATRYLGDTKCLTPECLANVSGHYWLFSLFLKIDNDWDYFGQMIDDRGNNEQLTANQKYTLSLLNTCV